MYYVQGETMEVIAHHLGVSRSTVSRLLARARQEGVVRVSLVQPGGAGSLEGRMAQVFGVRTHIVPVREGTTEIHRLQQVASVAAAHMVDLIGALAEQGGAEVSVRVSPVVPRVTSPPRPVSPPGRVGTLTQEASSSASPGAPPCRRSAPPCPRGPFRD